MECLSAITGIPTPIWSDDSEILHTEHSTVCFYLRSHAALNSAIAASRVARIPAIVRALRRPRGDRPKPRRVARRRAGPKDSADFAAIIMEHREVVI
jgi:hypothetical protein